MVARLVAWSACGPSSPAAGLNADWSERHATFFVRLACVAPGVAEFTESVCERGFCAQVVQLRGSLDYRSTGGVECGGKGIGSGKRDDCHREDV
jgi:hypothetical protein